MALSLLTSKTDNVECDNTGNSGSSIEDMLLDEFEKANLVIPVWSEILQAKIMFLSTESLINKVPDDIVWYSAKELKILTSKDDISVETIRAIHKTKKNMRGSKIINFIKNEYERVNKWKK